MAALLLALVVLQGVDDDALRDAVRRLGDPDPAVRTSAQASLLAVEPGRLPLLKKELEKAVDPELRGRLQAVIEAIEERAAGPFLTLAGVKLEVLKVRLSRDFFPPGRTLSPDTGSAMTADVRLFLRNTGAAEIRVVLSSAVVVCGDGRAALTFDHAVDLKPGEAKELSLRGDGGPRWRPGTAADLHLRVRVGDVAGRLAVRKIRIGMSS